MWQQHLLWHITWSLAWTERSLVWPNRLLHCLEWRHWQSRPISVFGAVHAEMCLSKCNLKLLPKVASIAFARIWFHVVFWVCFFLHCLHYKIATQFQFRFWLATRVKFYHFHTRPFKLSTKLRNNCLLKPKLKWSHSYLFVPQDEDSLCNKLCTFTITQKEFMNQHW